MAGCCGGHRVKPASMSWAVQYPDGKVEPQPNRGTARLVASKIPGAQVVPAPAGS